MQVRRLLWLFVCVSVCGASGSQAADTLPSSAAGADSVSARAAAEGRRLLRNFARPLSFESTPDHRAHFISRGHNFDLGVSADGAQVRLKPASKSGNPRSIVRMNLPGSNSKANGTGLDLQSSKSNYFIGNDPKQWRTNVANYDKVRFSGVYPGIDVVYYGNQGQLEYDFIVSPTADPHRVKLVFEGADKVSLDRDGDLVAQTRAGEVRLKKPVLYQDIDGQRREITGAYVLHGRNRISFAIGKYDRSRTLFIDPVLSFSTYLGGSNDDLGVGVATDASGNVYVAGQTLSSTFTFVLGNGNYLNSCFSSSTCGQHDVFVAKFNPAGVLLYTTFVGGSGDDLVGNSGNHGGVLLGASAGGGIAVGATGDVYVTGSTSSPDFPVTGTAFQRFCEACSSNNFTTAFVFRLNAGSTFLSYSTYLGGFQGGDQTGSDIKVDAAGNAFVVGSTNAADFPVTTGALQATFPASGGSQNAAFVTKLTADGSALIYSTFLGAPGKTLGYAIAVDGSGNAYVTGSTQSPTFPGSTSLAGFAPNELFLWNGSGWSGFPQAQGSLPNDNILLLQVDPTTFQTLYASTENNGLFKSTDQGFHWSPASSGLTDVSTSQLNPVEALLIDPANPQVILAGTSSGIFLSNNGGQAWGPTGLQVFQPDIRGLVLDPSSPVTSRTIYAADNGGCCGPGGVLKSTDGGNSFFFTGLNNISVRALAIDPITPSNLYAATKGQGVFRSTDGGNTWTPGSGTPLNLDQTSLVVDPQFHTTLYLGTIPGVFRSTDSGNTWTLLAGSPLAVTSLALNPNAVPSQLYASSFIAPVSTSTDGGGTWSILTGGGTFYSFRNIALSPGNGFLYAAPIFDHIFLTKLNPTGTLAVYSALLGGQAVDEAYGIAVDAGGNAYLTGVTASPQFGVSGPALKGPINSFVTAINSSASQFLYTTYFGGSGFDEAHKIALDANNNAWVTGMTSSSNLPLVSPLFSTLNGGASVDCSVFSQVGSKTCNDAFVAEFSSFGSILFSTYLGGESEDQGFSIATDPAGNAVLTGATASGLFPLANAAQGANAGGVDAFVTRIQNSSSSADLQLLLSHTPAPPATLLEDPIFTAVITNNGPSTATGISFAAASSGGQVYATNAGLAKCTTISFGSVNCSLGSLAAGASATITFHGFPNSAGIMTVIGTVAALQTDPNPLNNAASDSVQVTCCTFPNPNAGPTNLSFNDQQVGTVSSGQSVTVTNSGAAPALFSSLTLFDNLGLPDFSETDNCGFSSGLGFVLPGRSCTITVTFAPQAPGLITGFMTLNGLNTFSLGINLQGTGVTASAQGSSIITTFAGNGAVGYIDGPALSAEIGHPTGMAMDSNGNLFIADSSNNVVRRVDAQTHVMTTIAGQGPPAAPGYSGDGGPASQAQLSDPRDLAMDAAGNLFIADTGNNVIRKIDTSGTITTLVPASAGLNSPFGIALDKAGDLFISDSNNRVIRKLDTSQNLTIIAGTFGVAGFDGQHLGQPIGLSVDASGNVLISDFTNHAIREIDTSGNLLTIAGNGKPGYSGDGGPASAATLNGPSQTAFDAAGNIIIADGGNNVLREIGANGTINTIAGQGPPASAGFSGDGGQAVNAQMNLPRRVLVDKTGDIFISDESNARIRVIVNGAFLQFIPPNLVFDTTTAGGNSQTVDLVNIGNGRANLGSNGITISGANAADFSLVNHCFSTLFVTQDCTVTVNFSPGTSGGENAALNFAYNSVLGSQNAPLSSGSFTVTVNGQPLSSGVTFPPTVIGSTSSLTGVMTNTLSVPVNISDSTLFGPFGISSLPSSVAPNSSANFTLTFSPTASSNNGGVGFFFDVEPEVSGNLSGIGLSNFPTVSLSPSGAFYNDVLVGSSSTQNFFVTNNGNVAVNVTSASAGAPYSVTPLTFPIAVAPGQTITLPVVFAPAGAGFAGGSLTVNFDHSLPSLFADLGGNGVLQTGPVLSFSSSATTFLSTAGHPAYPIVADFNNDGVLDIAVADTTGNINIFLGIPCSVPPCSFQPPIQVPFAGSPTGRIYAVVGDFNGDGNRDLAIATSAGVFVYLGDGFGSFSAPSKLPIGAVTPEAVAVGDFNGDGAQDLAVASGSSVQFFFGNGDGTFSAGSSFTVGSTPNYMRAGDLNGDGIADLAVVDPGSGNVFVITGGTFQVLGPNPTGSTSNSQPSSVVIGDLNGDGIPDLLIANSREDSVTILNGDGTGNFPSAKTIGGVTSPFEAVIADLNGDNFLDIAVSDFSGNMITTLLNDGTNNFVNTGGFSTISGSFGVGPKKINIADFNNDGLPDLVISDTTSNDVGVWVNTGTLVSGISNNPRLRIQLDSSSNPIVLGNPALFTATVFNDSAGFANNVSLTLNFADLNTVSNVNGSCNVSGTHALICSLGTIGGFSSSSVSLTITPNAAGPYDISASAVVNTLESTGVRAALSLLAVNGISGISNGFVFTTAPTPASGWTPLNAFGPDPRADSSAAYDPISNTVILFGGTDNACVSALNDLWLLSDANGIGSTPSWNQVFTDGAPPPRRSHSAGYNPATNKMVIFGGDGSCSSKLNDTWVLSNANLLTGFPFWSFESVVGGPPAARSDQASAYDPASNTLMIFGGFDGSNNLFDTWVLSNADGTTGTPTWTQLATVGGPPSTPHYPSAAYDPGSNRLMVFGGEVFGAPVVSNQVWILTNANGTGGTPQWQLLNTVGTPPSPRLGHTGVYDATVNEMLIFGGDDQNGNVFNDTWVLSNANGLGGTSVWTQLSPTGQLGPPTPRGGSINRHTATYDTSNKVMTIFGGGNNGSFLNDSWALGLTPSLAVLPSFIGFPQTATGDSSAVSPVAIINIGNAPITVNGVIISGQNAGDFNETDTCKTVLQPNQQCTVNLVFAPTLFQNCSSAFAQVANSAGAPISVFLNGCSSGGSLGLSMTAAPEPVAVGQNLTYSVSVQNFNSSPATQLVVTDPLPAGVNFVAASPGCSFTSGTVTCTLPNLNANQLASANIVVTPTPVIAGSQITNTVTVTSAQPNFGGPLQAVANSTVLPTGFNAPPMFTSVPDFGTFICSPNQPVIADFNGDGIPDLAIASSCGLVYVELGLGGGNYAPGGTLYLGQAAIGMVAGDFNGDGNMDLAITTPFSVMVLLGDGAGNFIPQPAISADSGPYAIAAADVNNDGKLDLAVTNEASNDVSILLGNGDGTFNLVTNIPVGLNPEGITAADFNHDGKADLAVTNISSNTVTILLGNGDGTFAQPFSPFAAGAEPFAVKAADFNGDGNLDLAIADNSGAGSISVLLGDGTGNFSAPNTINSGFADLALAIGDFNGDGHLDIFSVDRGSNAGFVLLGDGAGNFTNGGSFPVGSNSAYAAAGDLNGDGRSDVVVTNFGSSSISVLLNAGTFAPAATDLSASLSVSPNPAIVGSTLTFTTTVTNRGPLTATNVTLTAPAGLGVASLPPGCTQQGVFVVCNVGSLAPGVSGSFSLTSQPVTTPGTSVGLVFVSADQPDLNLYDNLARATFTVLPSTFTNLPLFTQPPKNYLIASTEPNGPAVGDFNNDGFPDVAVVDRNGGNGGDIAVFLNDGAGNFLSPIAINLGGDPQGVVVGDFNNDGNLDLAVPDFANNQLLVLLGNGNGSFQPAVSYNTGSGPTAAAVGDFNRDGIPDIAVANFNDDTITILLGNGDGTFRTGATLVLTETNQSEPTAIATFDFNQDGIPDLAVTTFLGDNVQIFLGNGDGTFGNSTPYFAGFGQTSVAAADLNGDGVPDLVVGNFGTGLGNTVMVLLANGPGNFNPAVPYVVGTNLSGSQPSGVVIGDFNGDGKLDIASANYNSNNVSVLLGDGAGNFTLGGNFAVHGGPAAIAMGDFNRDGRLDLVTANFSTGDISTLMNQGTFAAQFANLTLTAAASANPVQTGVPFTFNLTVSNAGPLQATGVVLYVTLPPSALYSLTSVGAPGTCNLLSITNSTFACYLNSVPAAGQSLVVLTGTALTSATLTISARVVANQPEPISSSNSVTFSVSAGTPGVTVAPTGLSFGNTFVGATSAPLSVVLTNNAATPVTISSIVASPGFTESDTCNNIIAASGACTLNISFVPMTAGPASGTLTVTDSASNSPQVISLSGSGITPPPPGNAIIRTIAGGALPNNVTALGASIGVPFAIAEDSAGNIYMGAVRDNAIFKLTPAGQMSIFAGTGLGIFNGEGLAATSTNVGFPEGLIIDNSGNFYYADADNSIVRRIDAITGTVTTVAGTPGIFGDDGDGGPATSATLSTPEGLALDGSGNLFIADNVAVRRVDAVTHNISTVAASLNGQCDLAGIPGPASTANLCIPTGLAIDAGGNLLIADFGYGAIFRVDSSQNLSYVTGNPNTCTFPGDGGPAASACVFGPQSLSVDTHGNIFIADSSDNTIRRIDGTTQVITTPAGTHLSGGVSGDGGPATSALLRNPFGVIADPSGNIVIADSHNNRLRVVDTSGNINTVAGGGNFGDGGPALSAELSGPWGVAVDGSGNVFIGDIRGYEVREVNAGTGIISAFAGTGLLGTAGDGGPASAANLTFAAGVNFDSNGNLFLIDNNRIRRIDAITGVITTVAGQVRGGYSGDGGPATAAKLRTPQGFAIDPLGNLFIADTFNNRVRRVDAVSGMITTVAGNGTAGNNGDNGPAIAAMLTNPTGVAVDSAGNFYIADVGNNRVRRVDAATQNITPFAGTGTPGFLGDGGQAANALLSGPQNVALDSSGNLFIADDGNGALRRVDAATGIITTFAGTGKLGFSGDGGLATSAQLGSIVQFAIDGSGNLFLSDVTNNLIREVITVPSASLSAPSLDFGAQFINAPPVTQNLSITNTGGGTLTVSSVTVTGTNASDFVANDGCTTLAPSASCIIGVTFVPTIVGAESATLVETDSTGTHNVPLSGTGLPASADVSVSMSASPASPAVGDTLTYTITVGNAGPSNADGVVLTDTLPSGLASIVVSTGTIQACYFCSNNFGQGLQDGPIFVITNTGTTPITGAVLKILSPMSDSFSIGTIAAGATAFVIPGLSNDGATGHNFFAYIGSANDTSDNGEDADTTQFEFTGVQGQASVDSGIFTPAATISPSNDGTIASINFLGGPDDGACNDCFGPKQVATLNVTSGSPSLGSCTTGATISCSLGTLPPGGTATVTIAAATSAGTFTNTATATAIEPDPNSANNTATLQTTVGGSNPAPTITSFVLANNGQVTVSGSGFVPVSTVQWNGNDRATTFVSATQLVGTLLPGDITGGADSLTVSTPPPGGGTSNIVSVPIDTGSYTVSTLQPTVAPAGSSGVNLVVQGSGFVPGLVVRWNGNARSTTFISGTQLSAAITAADLSTPGLATITVANMVTGKVSNALTLPVTDFKASVSPATLSVARGSSGTMTVSLAPVGGAFAGNVTLTCAGLPAGVTCSFSPATVNPGSTGATSTLTISVSSTAVLRAPLQRPALPLFALWIGGLPLFGVVLIGATPRRKRSTWLLLGLLLLVVLAQLGCGGGGGGVASSAAPPPGSASQTVSFTIQAVSGTLQHTTTATLTIP